MSCFLQRLVAFVVLAVSAIAWKARGDDLPPALREGSFAWETGAPLLPLGGAGDPEVAIKDPSIVFHDGRWHLFATAITKAGQVGLEYLQFAEWSGMQSAPRTVLTLGEKFYAAPQVFYFTQQRRWYLIYQTQETAGAMNLRPSFSTTADLADPKSWTPARPMIPDAPNGMKWVDFWVICDAAKAHLFYTSNDGHLWRRETRLAEFPLGWSEPVLALEGDIYEASHTYKLKGREQYLTLIEAQAAGRRYYKAYLADRLEGPWRGLADSLARPFAARENVRQSPEWTAHISHGELIRTGTDERLEVDPANLQFLFQGVADADYRGVKYRAIPWRLGLLRPAR